MRRLCGRYVRSDDGRGGMGGGVIDWRPIFTGLFLCHVITANCVTHLPALQLILTKSTRHKAGFASDAVDESSRCNAGPETHAVRILWRLKLTGTAISGSEFQDED